MFVPHVDTFESQAQYRAWLFLRARYVVVRWMTELYHLLDGSSRRVIPSDPAAAENTPEDTAGCSSSTSSTVRVHLPPTRATSTSDMDTMVEDNVDTGTPARR